MVAFVKTLTLFLRGASIGGLLGFLFGLMPLCSAGAADFAMYDGILFGLIGAF